jgi:cytochrome c5
MFEWIDYDLRHGVIIGVFCACILAFDSATADLSGSLEESQIILRLQPEAQPSVEAESMTPTTPSITPVVNMGQHRYKETCHICHETGLAGAPKFGDKSEWAPRIADGIEILVQRAIQGYKAMPPKGSCMNCSDEEIRQAVEYMVSQVH